MTDSITLTGLVATDPRNIVTSEGLAITTFRLASTQRRFDKKESRWMDAETNWYTVTAFRQLALNAMASLRKGERVVVTGRLKIRSWDNGEKTGTNVDVEAEAVGHDLAWGTTAFNRTILVSSAAEPSDGTAPDSAARDAAAPGTGWADAAPVPEQSTPSSIPGQADDPATPTLEADATPVPF